MDHEIIRRAGENTLNELCDRDAIMKSKNKRKLARVLSTFNAWEDLTTENHDAAEFDHDEADIIMISYATEAADSGKRVIHVFNTHI